MAIRATRGFGPKQGSLVCQNGLALSRQKQLVTQTQDISESVMGANSIMQIVLLTVSVRGGRQISERIFSYRALLKTQ